MECKFYSKKIFFPGHLIRHVGPIIKFLVLRVTQQPPPPTSFSTPFNLLRWSSRDPFCTPIDATASRWRSIHWPTRLAFCANCLRSLSLFCWCAISCCRLESRTGTRRCTSRHLPVISYNQHDWGQHQRHTRVILYFHYITVGWAIHFWGLTIKIHPSDFSRRPYK